MKKTALIVVLSLLCLCAQAKSFELKSPDGNIKLKLDVAERISYTVDFQGYEIMSAGPLEMKIGAEVLGLNPKLKSSRFMDHERRFTPVVAYKSAVIEDVCRVLRLDFKGDWSLEFRAYNDGVAYRFITDFDGRVEVMDERLSLDFPEGTRLIMQRSGHFETPYEEPYEVQDADLWKAGDRMAMLPFLADLADGNKLLVSESDLYDYPCLFFESDGSGVLKSTFPKVRLEEQQWGDRHMRAVKRAEYIAETSGSRSYPWRYFVITSDDGKLIENTMTARLAQAPEGDMSWVRPGQVSWEFWNAASPYGPDVDFVAGLNTETYKYFIDFASKYGIPYIILDEGWAKSTLDPYTPSASVDVKELIKYGEERGVGLILWMTWLVVDRNPDMFGILSEWGVKGVKIDFMNRSDQYMVNYYERVAEAAAKHKMVVSFHGSFKPAGLEYKYPNVLTYEGVRGMENMGGCTPANSIWMPFIRNAVGPMDYTPGAMISMQPESYCGNRPNAASVGTRAYQLALYVVMESGLQMLSDSPTLYYNNPDCTEFISSVPVTWDETRALKCKAGEYAVVAKRHGSRWFIGALNGTDRPLEVDVPLDFLKDGKEYRMENFEDGPNAFRQAMDYRRKISRVGPEEVIRIRMARNGGWTAVLE